MFWSSATATASDNMVIYQIHMNFNTFGRWPYCLQIVDQVSSYLFRDEIVWFLILYFITNTCSHVT